MKAIVKHGPLQGWWMALLLIFVGSPAEAMEGYGSLEAAASEQFGIPVDIEGLRPSRLRDAMMDAATLVECGREVCVHFMVDGPSLVSAVAAAAELERRGELRIGDRAMLVQVLWALSVAAREVRNPEQQAAFVVSVGADLRHHVSIVLQGNKTHSPTLRVHWLLAEASSVQPDKESAKEVYRQREPDDPKLDFLRDGEAEKSRRMRAAKDAGEKAVVALKEGREADFQESAERVREWLPRSAESDYLGALLALFDKDLSTALHLIRRGQVRAPRKGLRLELHRLGAAIAQLTRHPALLRSHLEKALALWDEGSCSSGERVKGEDIPLPCVVDLSHSAAKEMLGLLSVEPARP